MKFETPYFIFSQQQKEIKREKLNKIKITQKEQDLYLNDYRSEKNQKYYNHNANVVHQFAGNQNKTQYTKCHRRNEAKRKNEEQNKQFVISMVIHMLFSLWTMIYQFLHNKILKNVCCRFLFRCWVVFTHFFFAFYEVYLLFFQV